ncbi:GNAT family protein [Nonomuraea sp. NPDC000554]|uniref:GNAT family N-acetyltransferase n=1 Tax=Nonomuraea sp. NPDC000554 TaxID=3154259 RepID=UPI00332C3B48
MLRPDYPIRTERLLLRPLTAADLDAMHAYKSQPDVVRYVPYDALTRDEVAERIAGRWSQGELTAPGQVITLGIEEQHTGRLVGDVVLFWHSAEHRSGEIGYILSPEATGRGYATEASQALLRLGFDGLGLHRIIAQVDDRNAASARVLERLGFRLEAHFRENEWFKGEWSSLLVYALLDREWGAAENPGASAVTRSDREAVVERA